MLDAPAQRRTLSFTITLAAATIGVIHGDDTGSIAGALLLMNGGRWPDEGVR
jgi:hypothetical protein